MATRSELPEAPQRAGTGGARPARRLADRIFPGSRPVWLAGALVLVLAVVFAVRFGSAGTASLTGTNSVGVGAVVARAEAGTTTCVRDLVVPRGTGRVALWVGPQGVQPGARIDGWIQARGARIPLRQPALPATPGFSEFTLPRPVAADAVGAAVCLRPRRLALDLGGASVQRLPDAPVTTVGGTPLAGADLSVLFLVPEGRSRTVFQALDDALRRATVFEPGVGVVLVWLALPLLLGLIYAVLRVAAVAPRLTVRRLAFAAAAVAFAHACVWAVLLHPFHGADESEHFAYAQHLAATNQRPATEEGAPQPPYSSSQLRLLEALHHNSTVLNPSSRLRWEDHWETRYGRAAVGTTDTDGGGYTVSASRHSPLYYGLVGLPHRVLGGTLDLPAVLLVMRLFNALLAATVAAFAVAAAAALFGRHLQVAWAAGVLAALQPVFGSVAATVNNDTAVNVAGAALLYALVRSWARGPTPRLAVAVGALAVLLPVAKVTGYSLVPVVPIAGVLLAARYGLRAAARWAGIAGATALAVVALWAYGVSPLVSSSGGGQPTGVSAPSPPGVTMQVRAEYFLQTLLPFPTVGRDHWDLPGEGLLEDWPGFAIYIDRGYGLFGWKSTSLTSGMERAIFYGLLVGWVLAAVAALQRLRAWRRWAGGSLILLSALAGVLALISYAYATAGVAHEPGEQGRYVFPALVPLAVGFSAALFAVRGRLRQLAVGVMVTGAACLALFAWATALRGWFT